MASRAKLVVELTSDEKRLLDGFRKSQAADDDFRAGLKKTGVELDETGKAMVDAMLGAAKSTEIASDKIVKQLRGAGAEGKKLFAELSKNSQQSIEEILSKLDKVDDKMSAQARNILAEWAKTDSAAKFEKTRAQLESLGGDFKVLGAEIKKATEIPEDRVGAARKLVDELHKIDPNKAQAIAKAMEEAKRNVEKTRLDQFVAKLAGGTKEARELAKLLGQDMQEASLAAENGIEGISQKIIALRPDLKTTVDKWKADMAEAAKFGEGKYEKALDALRGGDKVSKEVAKKIKKNLLDAGKIVERGFEDMIAPLEKIDPKLAAEAKKWQKELKKNEDKSKSTFGAISKYAIAEIASIATAYIGIQEAVQFVTETIQQQQSVLEKASDSQKSLASAQKDAQKNLSAFDDTKKRDLLLNLVPETARSAVFSDLNQLTKAIGDTASAGASYEQIKAILPIAAGLNRETPEFVDETATAMADSIRATGMKDPKLNVAQQLLVGSTSRVVDPAKLLRNLAPVQVAAAESVPEKYRAEAAAQASAAFAAFTKSGADSQGDASQTAIIQYMARLRSFFNSLGEDATTAKAELEKLKDPLTATDRLRLDTLSANEANANRTNMQIDQIESKRTEIQGRLDAGDLDPETRRRLGIQKRILGEKLGGLKRVEFGDAEKAQLADLRTRTGASEREYQEKKATLEGKIAGANIEGFEGQAPILFFDQVKAIQQNPQLAEAFGKISFGEQRFRSAGEQFSRGGTAYQDAMATRKLIRQKGSNTDIVDNLLRQDQFLTPQQETAFLREKSAVGESIRANFDTYGGSMGQQRKDLARVLGENRSDGYFSPFVESFDEMGISTGMTLGGGTRLEEAVSGIGKLARRRTAIRKDGITPLEETRLGNIDDEVDAFMRRVSSAISLQESPETLQKLQSRYSRFGSAIREGGDGLTGLDNTEFATVRHNEEIFLRLEEAINDLVLMQKLQLEASKETANNTKPNKRSPTDAQREAAKAADRRRNTQ